MPLDPELVHDDGSPTEIVCGQDDAPRSGTWVDPEDFYAEPTDDELAKGDHLGRTIDVDDDDDNGLEQ